MLLSKFKNIIIYSVIFFIFSSLYGNTQDSQVFSLANTKYSEGNFKEAIKLYNKILSTGTECGVVWYNLGNSHYKNGNILHAIYSYENALKFIPGDQDLHNNLEICRFSLKDKIDTKVSLPLWSWIAKIRDTHSMYQNLFYALLFLALTSLILGLTFFLNRVFFQKKIFQIGLAISLLLFMVFSYFSIDQYNVFFKKGALVAVNEASIKSSPDENSSSVELFKVHYGFKFSVEKELNDWIKVIADSKKKGWLKKNEVILLN